MSQVARAMLPVERHVETHVELRAAIHGSMALLIQCTPPMALLQWHSSNGTPPMALIQRSGRILARPIDSAARA